MMEFYMLSALLAEIKKNLVLVKIWSSWSVFFNDFDSFHTTHTTTENLANFVEYTSYSISIFRPTGLLIYSSFNCSNTPCILYPFLSLCISFEIWLVPYAEYTLIGLYYPPDISQVSSWFISTFCSLTWTDYQCCCMNLAAFSHYSPNLVVHC